MFVLPGKAWIVEWKLSGWHGRMVGLVAAAMEERPSRGRAVNRACRGFAFGGDFGQKGARVSTAKRALSVLFTLKI